MTRRECLLDELSHEARTARKYLERLPTAHFDWRPHPRSFTAGHLGSHLVDCIRWVEPVFAADELDLDPRRYRPFVASTTEELLAGFDADVARAIEAMSACQDTNVDQPWRLKMLGKVRFEKSREDVFRDMTFNHLLHHRGQLSVYLRLLDIRLPGAYGPTADDQ